MTVLAIRAGGNGVGAFVVSAAGDVVARGYQELAQHLPHPGWVEQAPEELWRATLGATLSALEQVDASELRSIGVANQRETVLLWDRETLGSPRPAIGSLDQRAGKTCSRLRDDGHEERVEELTGLRLDPYSSATRLRWLAEHEPRTWRLVESGRYAVGSVESYLIARMTRGLEHVTDVSNASRTLLFDLAAGDWSDELCALFGVPKDALPELVPSWGEAAVTDPRSFVGLDLPVAGIAGEEQAALFGQTCFEVGDSQCTLGATSHVLLTTGAELRRSETGLWPTVAWRAPTGELTHALQTTIVVPEAAARWLRDGAPVGADRATLEAIAAAVRDVLGTVHGTSLLRVDGYAATDDLLCQLHADLLGIPVERPREIEAAALGAAFLAGLGAGVWKSFGQLRAVRQLERSFAPAEPG